MSTIPLWIRWGYVGGLCIAAMAMPWNRQVLNVALIVLGAAWLSESVFVAKAPARLKRFLQPAFLLPASMFLVYAIGICWSQDLDWAWRLLAIVIPLLLYPFFFAVLPPLNKNEVTLVLAVFTAAVSIVSILGYLSVSGEVVTDFRDYSPIISHIRLSMMCCLVVATCVYGLFNYQGAWKWIALPVLIWTLYYLSLLASFQSVLVLGILLIHGLWTLGNWRTELRMIGRVSSVLLVSATLAVLATTYHDYFTLKDGTIEQGSESELVVERGRSVWSNVSKSELNEAWSARSELDLFGEDQRGQELYRTLCRYMTSLDLPKDRSGMEELTDLDVKRIESGIAWADMGQRNPLRERLDILYFQWDKFRRFDHAAGGSVAMRLIFWRTGWDIAKRNLLTGVGTGDTQLAFDSAYEEHYAQLPHQYRLRAHQQYLTWLISFGLIGFTWLMVSLFYPIIRRWNYRHALFTSFLLIVLIGFLTDDTLERQIGATLFAYFYGLFLLAASPTEADPDTVPMSS